MPPVFPLVPARLDLTADGTPFSEAFGDVYHSADGGLGQARHVFLAGNGLPGRWQGRSSFAILETGFGLGLNFLATWSAWRMDPFRPARLHYIAAEKHPFPAADLAVLHGQWPDLGSLSAELLAHWPSLVPGFHRLHLEGGRVTLTLLFGDALDTLPRLAAAADALYLDGFSPAKNPDLWSPDLFRQLRRLAAPGATLATYTVSAPVRNGLAGAGFSVEKRPGFGRKRDMLIGRLETAGGRGHEARTGRRVLVIGAGLAGSAVAQRLGGRGWQVEVLDGNPGPAQGASGNLTGVFLPMLSRDDNIAARLSRACYLYAPRHWRALEAAGAAPRWASCGVIQIGRDADHEVQQRDIAALHQYPPDYLAYLDREAMGQMLGRPVAAGGWLFPGGGWASPPDICAANLGQEGIRTHFGVRVARLDRQGGTWRAWDETGTLRAEAETVVLASGAQARDLDQSAELPVWPIRGQVSYLPEARLAVPDRVVCRDGYLAPAVDGLISFGASYSREREPALRLADHRDNLARLEGLLPGSTGDIDPAALTGRVSFRPASGDRLPLIGELPNSAALAHARCRSLEEFPRWEGLYGLLGYGSRGLVWASMAAELLASRLNGEPLPLETDLTAAVDPARFAWRAYRRGE